MKSDILKSTVAALFLVLQAMIGFVAYVGTSELTSLRTEVNSLNNNMAAILVQVSDISTIERDVRALTSTLGNHLADPETHAAGFSRVSSQMDAVHERVRRLERIEEKRTQ